MNDIDSLMDGSNPIHENRTIKYVAGLIRLAYRLGANNSFKWVNTSRIEGERQLRRNTLSNNITAAISTRRLSTGNVGLLWSRPVECEQTTDLINVAREAKADILERRYTEKVADLLTQTCKFCKGKPRNYSALGKEIPNHDF